MNTGKLLAIGGAYVDFNAPNFPLGPQGLTLESEVVGSEYSMEPGGSAVNFARMCCALEVPTTFIGKAGKDELGGILSKLLLDTGVEPLLIQSEDVSTNVSFNMINPGGESIMAVVGTANQSLTAEEVYEIASNRMETASVLFLGGCFKLKKLLPAFVQLTSDAKQAGVMVALDHGRINQDITDEEKRIVRELALASDVYLPSADEFMQLWDVASIDEGLACVRAQSSTVTVVKNGENGAVSSIDGKILTVPAYRVTPIHTVGAGDSFDAGFIAARHVGLGHVSSIRFGCATAALKISRQQLPTHRDVQEFLSLNQPKIVEVD